MSTENNPEITSLNAEDLDADQLGDEQLEDASGGFCVSFSCGTYSENPNG